MNIRLDFITYFFRKNHRREIIAERGDTFETGSSDPRSYTSMRNFCMKSGKTIRVTLFFSQIISKRNESEPTIAPAGLCYIDNIVFLFIFPEWAECRSLRSVNRNTAHIRWLVSDEKKKRYEIILSEKLYEVVSTVSSSMIFSNSTELLSYVIWMTAIVCLFTLPEYSGYIVLLFLHDVWQLNCHISVIFFLFSNVTEDVASSRWTLLRFNDLLPKRKAIGFIKFLLK